MVLERPGFVLSNTTLTPTLGLMVLEVESIPALVQPGQFIHVGFPELANHILRRPFSVMRADAESNSLTVLYQAVGEISRFMLTLQPGYNVSIMGPIGTGWSVPESAQKPLLVGGGVGAAPLFMLAQSLKTNSYDLEVVVGAQSENGLVCLPHYSEVLGKEPLCTTDDGSYGTPGFVTELVETLLAEQDFDYVACCGPEPMMKAVSALSLHRGITTQISLERRMACGIGACLSCVVDTALGKKRACIDGPVFDAREVIW